MISNSNDLLRQLKDKQKSLQDLSIKKSKLEGQREQILSDLKKKFNLTSLDEAKVELESVKVSLNSKEEEIKSLIIKMDEIIEKANAK